MPALLPALVSAFWGALILIIENLVARVIASLAIGVVSYAGVGVTLGWLKDQAIASLSGLSADMLGLMAYMKVGEAVSIVFSALVVRLTLNGLAEGGKISKIVKR